ncbi:putative F420-0 ABC transporter substrate-binding protein [Agromyces atrinae]|uniref:Iron complex transport system substrate-binding protein n=1 Tax=Agromyces atrinae TaxID=592376 RepID=A0A4Q2MCF8_9MICO|nr:putative F420-0 ABC transporter substrate-binding protein [Agromyces atrinae]NYD68068.1 iron complex transport system substrate-binding protein [Agromyces atrinae]RXZ87781.1 putative F420-0 ABC transporter substrate-binding protein [Agromyces atrinae]
MFRRRLLTTSLAALGIVALAGCAGSPAAAPSPTPTADAEPARTSYPLTIDNCGTEVTFESAPERVLTIKSTTTELLLALGLSEKMVGAAFLDSPLPEFAPPVEIVSDKVPGQEATLALEPDLVFAGWESNLTAEGAGDRDLLASLGVNTYVAPSACKEPGYQPDPLTFEALFEEFDEVGAIFDLSDVTNVIVEDQQAMLDAITPLEGAPTALWYSSGTDTPYVGAGIGAPQMMLDAAGLENIAADVDDTWSALSWEAVVDADPDVIVLIDAAWNTADSKIALLESNPATAALPAVQQKRYIVVPFAAGEAGIRNVEAVQSIVDQATSLGF